MATPKLDAIIMGARREYKDLRNKTTSLPIVAASENGTAFTAVAMTELVVGAINELIGLSRQSMTPEEMAQELDEFVIAVTISTPTVAGNIASFTLPSDYLFPISAIIKIATNSKLYRVKECTQNEWADAQVNTNTEQAGRAKGAVYGGKFNVVLNGETLTTSETLIFVYFSNQPATTQGSGTDVKLNLGRAQDVVKLILMKMHEDQS